MSEERKSYRKPFLTTMLSQVEGFERYGSDELIKRDDEDMILMFMAFDKMPIRVEYTDRQLFYVFLKKDVEDTLNKITLGGDMLVPISKFFNASRIWKSNIVTMKKHIEANG